MPESSAMQIAVISQWKLLLISVQLTPFSWIGTDLPWQVHQVAPDLQSPDASDVTLELWWPHGNQCERIIPSQVHLVVLSRWRGWSLRGQDL